MSTQPPILSLFSKSSSISPFLVIVLSLCCLFAPAQCAITSLTLTANPTTINSLSTHTWSITYSNSASRQTFILYFPDCDVIVNGTTSIMYNSVPVSNITEYGINYIKFTLPTAITANTYTFVVNNVKNCYRTANYSTFVVFNNIDGNQTGIATSTLYYTFGLISNCKVYFDGTTGNSPSVVHVDFNVQNQVIGGVFGVRFKYPQYYAQDLDMMAYNILGFSPYYTLSCGLSVNGILVLNSTSTTFNNKRAYCTFASPSSPYPSLTDTLTLHIYNIKNPIVSNIYATSIDFQITTYDSSLIYYDRSLNCAITPVPLSIFPSYFMQTATVNSILPSINILTNVSIPIRIAKNDKLLIMFNTTGFIGCSSTINIGKGSSPIQFIQQPSTISQSLLYLSNGSSDINSSILINFQICSFQMPVSTIPIDFQLKFSGTTSIPSTYDDYMQVSAVLYPQYSVMMASQVQLALTVSTIGDISSYIFSITTGQGLGQTPRIVIDMPTQINVGLAASTMSSCSLAINSTGIGSKNCQYLSPNSIQINFTYSNIVPNFTTLQLTLPNLKNPSNPSPLSNFNIRTYYSSSIPDGLVQSGTNIVTVNTYSARALNAIIISNSTIVYQNALIKVQYLVGVDLPGGSVTVLTFIGGLLGNVAFVSVNASGSFISNTTNQFTFMLAPMSAGSTIQFAFTCMTPSLVDIYSVLNISTTYNSTQYQITQIPVTFQVTQPATPLTFTIQPSNTMTGVTTTYQFRFTTTVVHPSLFLVELTFPSNTNLINSLSVCSSGCNLTNFNDTSSGSIDRIQLLLNSSMTNTYTFTLTNIINQREVSQTQQFTLKTMTVITRKLILTGFGTAILTTANNLIANFIDSDDYYRSNVNLVHIQVNVTNRLYQGDYIIVHFTSSSYTRNGGIISCSQGNCTYTETLSTLDLKVVLTSAMTTDLSIDVQVFGLISNPTTPYGQQIPIQVQTYSSLSNLIDHGTLIYSLDCSQNPSIISKLCKTCANISLTQQVCTSCYSPTYSLFNSTLCTNNCSNISQYQTYNSSGYICLPCVPPCMTCQTQLYCTSCITGYYLLVNSNGNCIAFCDTSNGYYIGSQPTMVSSSSLFCAACPITDCISCPGGTSCQACKTGTVLLGGFCIGGCGSHMYNAGGVCKNCDPSCIQCDGGTNFNCYNCSLGYYPDNGQCKSGCFTGFVPLGNGTCGCDVPCLYCQGTSTQCLTCLNSAQFVYNYICYNTCPVGTYPIGKTCTPCSPGCQSCSSTTCTQCSNNYYIFQNNCYQNCKILGPSYTGMLKNNILKCDICPNGCSDCNINYQCITCLDGYIINGTICKRQCEFTNTCNDTPVKQNILPLPGVIAVGVWIAICVIAKIFLLPKMYLPYAVYFGGSLIQFVILVALLGSLVSKLQTMTVINTARLLVQSISTTSPLFTALGLLAVGLLLNYLMNIISIWIFYKFIKPMILPRQVDLISNYAALTFGILTSYRFYMIAFSRMFKKPLVQVSGPQKLKTLHIILGVSAVLDIIVLVAGFILVLNTTKLTIIFMLAIDVIVIIFIMELVFLWVVFRPKPQQYYLQTKKYSLQQNHITQQGSIHNNNGINQKDASKINLGNNREFTNQKLQVQEFNQENVDDLPTIQPTNIMKIAAKNTEKLDQSIENQGTNAKTKRKDNYTKKNQSSYNSKANKEFFNQKDNKNSQRYNNRELQRDATEPNFSISNRQRNNPNNKNARKNSQSQIEGSGIAKNSKDLEYQFQIQNDHNSQSINPSTLPQQKSIKKHKKPQIKASTQKLQQSNSMSGGVTSMKKKPLNNITYQSQLNNDSNIDQIDLDSIIQTRVIDRSKMKLNNTSNNVVMDGQQRDTRTQADKNQLKEKQKQYEEISPSWFNIQNQRYDIDDKDIEQ